MAKKTSLQGKNLMLWVEHKFTVDGKTFNSPAVISLSTECSVNLTPVTTDADTKDADIHELDIDKFNWTIQNTSQIVASDSEIAELKKLMEQKTPIDVVFGIADPNNDEGADYALESSNGYTPADDSAELSGRALITSLSETGAVGGKATAVITLQGITELQPAGDEPYTAIEMFADDNCTKMLTTGNTVTKVVMRITPMPTGSGWSTLSSLLISQHPEITVGTMSDTLITINGVQYRPQSGRTPTYVATGSGIKVPFGQIFLYGFAQGASTMSLDEPEETEE